MRIGSSLGAREPPRGSRVTMHGLGVGQVLRHRHRAAAVRPTSKVGSGSTIPSRCTHAW